MKQSAVCTKTKKEAVSDEVSRNAQLLLRGGFVHKEMAGVYSYLPLGLRVLNKIIRIIREEMESIGGQEVLLTALQEESLWSTTNRWDDAIVDVWFKTQLKNGSSLGLGFTHEEPMTRLLANHVASYRDMPQLLFQFQTKFRNETRAKSGIMRTREFIMKDLYSFTTNKEMHDAVYDRVKEAYHRIFKRVGLGASTYLTFASGGVFAPYSHEFQTITAAGEDIIYIDEEKGIAVNQEVYTDEVLSSLGLQRDRLVEHRAVEVGNIFTLGTRFSEPLGLTYQNEHGEQIPVFMGSYGIGPGRVMGTIVETLSDDAGIIWPESIAPFRVHLLALGEESLVEAEALYAQLSAAGVEVLLDDRPVSPGEKFADADLLGIPFRLVVSKRSTKATGYEIKKRIEKEARLVSESEVLAYVS